MAVRTPIIIGKKVWQSFCGKTLPMGVAKVALEQAPLKILSIDLNVTSMGLKDKTIAGGSIRRMA